MSSNKLSRVVLRIHGGILLLLMPLLMILSTIGLRSGVGNFAFLHAEPLADVGLFQLYAAMTIIGIVLIIGSFQMKSWIWNLVGLFAQITPFLSNFIFSGIYKQTGITPSWPLHIILLLLELLSLLSLIFQHDNHIKIVK